MNVKPFRLRSFVSLLLTWSALVMLVSGLVIYVVPEGRIAYWNDWRLLGLGKEQWGAIHTLGSLLFTVAAIWHLVLNWSSFMTYLKTRAGQLLRGRKELVVSVLITALFVVGSAAGVAPFQQVMDLSTLAKKQWYKGEDVVPPFPHAELMTIKQLASKIDLNLEGMLEVLKEQGLAGVARDANLKDLAQGTGRSPAEIFEEMMMDDRVY